MNIKNESSRKPLLTQKMLCFFQKKLPDEHSIFTAPEMLEVYDPAKNPDEVKWNVTRWRNYLAVDSNIDSLDHINKQLHKFFQTVTTLDQDIDMNKGYHLTDLSALKLVYSL
jgi:hypothetical protein